MKRPDEDDADAQARLNELAEGAGAGGDEGWTLGKLSHRGSVHQDIWRGAAYQLADRDGISVGPMRGWWGDIKDAQAFDREVRFSLIVGVKAPVGTDLFSEVSAAVPNAVRIEATTPITV